MLKINKEIEIFDKDLFETLKAAVFAMPTDYYEVVGSLTFPDFIRKPKDIHDVDIVLYDDEDILKDIVESDSFYGEMYPESKDVTHGRLVISARSNKSGLATDVTIIQKPISEFVEKGTTTFKYKGKNGYTYLRDIPVGSVEAAMLAKAEYLSKSGGKESYRKKHSNDIQNYMKWAMGLINKDNNWQ